MICSSLKLEIPFKCSIPVFEGLLPEPHNTRLMKLLFRTAQWHALAKLRLHTDSTLMHMDKLTKEFGQLMRKFRDSTCSTFNTVELPREVEARTRRNHRKESTARLQQHEATASLTSMHTESIVHQQSTKSSSTKKRSLNLSTYKWHSLGDYTCTIRMFGTTDSYSTQIVC